MAYMTAAQRSKATKRILSEIFGREYVRVKGGRGTAYGWIHAKVSLPVPADCIGNVPEHWHDCEPCQETMRLAERVCYKATEHLEYGTYCADDGYNTRHREVSFTARTERCI